MNWAAAHPEWTLAVYLDNAVCDFKSWPGGARQETRQGAGSDGEWKKLLAAYDFKGDDDAIAYKLNPVDNLAPLAKARRFRCCSSTATKTKWCRTRRIRNWSTTATRPSAGRSRRVVKPGQDHHPHGLKDVAPVVAFFHRCTRAEEVKGGEAKAERRQHRMAFFYATADDLLPVLLSVEARHSVVYTLKGPYLRAESGSFPLGSGSAHSLPPQPYESSVCGPTYLVTEAGTDVILRPVTPYEGKDRWAIDQLANPDSTVLRHGGLFGENILLAGEIRTAYKTKVATRLQRAFDTEIRKHFVKIGAYYVGPAAEVLLDSGYRLTAAAEQSPSASDLRRNPSEPEA